MTDNKESEEKKKREPPRRLAFLIPGSAIPFDDDEALEEMGKALTNHVRAMVGLPPAFDEEGNEIPGRIKRDEEEGPADEGGAK